jgi:hypothetical protein
MNGYMGKLLRVDMTSHKKEEDLIWNHYLTKN